MSMMEAWNRDQLEQEYVKAAEGLGWCEFYMKEWERGCDADKEQAQRTAARLAGVLAALVVVLALLSGALLMAVA